jgi:hypothetical protein
MSFATGLRRLGMGLATVTGLARQGFFIPYRYAGSVVPGDYPALLPLFRAAEPRFAEVLAMAGAWSDSLRGMQGPAPEPRWDQDWFPGIDGAAAYAIVRGLRPRRIVEIGSGHSTRFMARAIRDRGEPALLTCIDPSPRAKLDGLEVRHVPALLNTVPPSLFDELAARDVLFVDSSHIAMPGTDVDRLLGDVLPRLAPGVLVHFHDVFLPDAYPQLWRWRGYNEQLPLACLLQGGGFAPIFASHYLRTRRPERVRQAGLDPLPVPPDAFETSLWLEKRR